ncbi:hypothetical protein BN946_scf184709.g7 [Trametes cinnabarina]|uniref:PB1 domain-containing protein n=1 Tax=Pycnoporus cinnabarinus TaxID=5643 RepID=A0A060SRF2_PYCCI|nr:hypothetical protein BN946_scf184709.g7 [Trametes cinnabarina]
MSLKAELETWAAALQAYDAEDFEKSLELFSQIADSSKILTTSASSTPPSYLAVAYFQCGVSNFLLTRYDAAYNDFSSALLYLRGNQYINYEQLGLKFKLYSAEVLFNRGLTQIYMGNMQEGLADMEDARKEKATEEHGVIDDAIQDRGEGYTVFSIPVGVLYRPPQKKLEGSKTKDYLGKAKLIAAESPNDLFTEFTGVARLKQGITPTGVFVEDGPNAANPNLQRAVTVAASVPKPANGDDPKPAGLQRAKTTITLHYREEVRGMALQPETSFEEFMDMVQRKFGVVPGALGMKFKDEDGGQVTLRDEMDYELAIETARHSAKGRPEGRLEIWCMDE